MYVKFGLMLYLRLVPIFRVEWPILDILYLVIISLKLECGTLQISECLLHSDLCQTSSHNTD